MLIDFVVLLINGFKHTLQFHVDILYIFITEIIDTSKTIVHNVFKK